jgi:hypothetical protein
VVPKVIEKPEGRLQIPTKLKQFLIFTARDIRSKISDLQYVLINSLEAPLLAVILAFLVKEFPTAEGAAYSFGKNVNIPAFFFISVIIALFMGLTVSAEEIIKDRKILKRESFLHLSRGSYLYSKIGLLFGISAIQTFTFALIGCLILDIRGMFLAYWLVLFSTASFANVLGLNVSSAFKNAITVYILIPILLIPQLILGGVVVKFDDLHPKLRSHDKVPFVGDIMASRWAYEALLVHQFKHNAYQKHFFDDEQIMRNSDYKTVYFIPTLQSKLSSCRKLIGTDQVELLESNLKLLRNEIGKELTVVGTRQFPEYEKLTVDSLNNQVIEGAEKFLTGLRIYYRNKSRDAEKRRYADTERIKENLTRPENLNVLRNRYQNETVRDLVINDKSVDRIVEDDDQLVQKIYPIYIWSDSDHFLDFRTQFMVANKPLFGGYVDTFIFNVLAIWVMSFFLILLLYFDVLGRLVLR